MLKNYAVQWILISSCAFQHSICISTYETKECNQIDYITSIEFWLKFNSSNNCLLFLNTKYLGNHN